MFVFMVLCVFPWPHTPVYGGTKQAVRGFISSLTVSTRNELTLTFSLCFPSLGGCSSHPCSYLHKTGNQGLHIVSSSKYQTQNDLDLFLYVSLALEDASHTDVYDGTKQAVRDFTSSLAVSTKKGITLTLMSEY